MSDYRSSTKSDYRSERANDYRSERSNDYSSTKSTDDRRSINKSDYRRDDGYDRGNSKGDKYSSHDSRSSYKSSTSSSYRDRDNYRGGNPRDYDDDYYHRNDSRHDDYRSRDQDTSSSSRYSSKPPTITTSIPRDEQSSKRDTNETKSYRDDGNETKNYRGEVETNYRGEIVSSSHHDSSSSMSNRSNRSYRDQRSDRSERHNERDQYSNYGREQRDRDYRHENKYDDHNNNNATTKSGNRVTYRMPNNTNRSEPPANLPYQNQPSKFAHIKYDHIYRPNRPRNPSGWGIVGTPEEVEYVTRYLTSFSTADSHFSTKKDYRVNPQYSTMDPMQMNQIKEKEMFATDNNTVDLLFSLLPANIAQNVSKPTITSNNVDESLLNSLLPSNITANLQNGPQQQQQGMYDQNNNINMMNNYMQQQDQQQNQNQQQQNQYQYNDTPYITQSAAGTDVVMVGTKTVKPKVYIAGYPTHLSSDILRLQLPRIIYDNLILLRGRQQPELSQLGGYSFETAITQVYVHPTFVFMEFASFTDAEASLSLDGLPVTFVDEKGTSFNCSLNLRQPKDLAEYYKVIPPKHYSHPLIIDKTTTRDQSTNMQRVSSQVIDTSTSNMPQFKVYIGNIAMTLNEADLRASFNSIPNMVHFNWVNSSNSNATQQQRNTNQTNKIYAFATYSTRDDAELAINTFNNQLFGGRNLIVKLASNPDSNTTSNESNPYLQTTSSTTTTSTTMPQLGLPSTMIQQRQQQLQQQSNGQLAFPISDLPSEFIVFYNIVDIDEFNEEKDDIIADLVEGCTPYSKTNVKYRVEEKSNQYFPEGDVCVFLQCQDPLKASQILNKFHGKKFGPRIANVKFIDAVTWDSMPNVWVEPV